MTNQKQNESGKSAFETAYTLAMATVLIFIISFVSRWFYQVVFEDSVGESTIKEISQRAIPASGRFMTGFSNLSDGNNVTAEGYPITTYPINQQFFEMTLLHVPKKVCQYVIEKGPGLTSSIYVNGVLFLNQKDICQASNVMSFEFSKDLNSHVPDSEKPYRTHCQTNADCSGCEACQDGQCRTGCHAEETCGVSWLGKPVCCSAANQAGSMCCTFIQDGQCCMDRNKCCPMDKPIRLENGECVSCYDTKPFALGNPPELSKCQDFCPNRVAFGLNEMCMMPICSKDSFLTLSGDCVPCHQGGREKTSMAECMKCPNRTYQNGLCWTSCPDGTMMDKEGVCRPCDELKAFVPERAEACSTQCPTRELKEGQCQLKVCPEGMIKGTDGQCYPCNDRKAVATETQEECEKCPLREYDQNHLCRPICAEGQFLSAEGQCVSCDTLDAVPVAVADGECLKCPSRLALNGYCFAACGKNQFRDLNGNCHSCFDKGSYPVLKTAVCNVCSNRMVQIERKNGQNAFYCRIDPCPNDHFTDERGGCYECENELSIPNTSYEECEKCSNRQWSALNHQCFIRPQCLPEEIVDANGACVSCYASTELVNVFGQEAECDKCAERYVYGHWCRNCPTDVQTLTDKKACQKCGGKWDNRLGKCQA